MSQIKVIALDLDGTLLNSEKKISPRNLAAIRAAQEKGVKVVKTLQGSFDDGSSPQGYGFSASRDWDCRLVR